jgi:hypothetical protein
MNVNRSGDRHRTYPICIAVSVLVVYILAIYADYLPIDDGSILQSVQSGKVSISSLFFSGGKEYYRPLAILSLMGDFYLFGGKIAGYHLVNILLHLCNALLVYLLAMIILKEKKDAPFYSFLAGLLFALHPVNSEAVVWIACRPELLCCLFSLLCIMTVLQAEKYRDLVLFTYLFIFCLCAFLAKEASFFLPIIIPFYIIIERKRIGLKKSIVAIVALLVAVTVYLLLRKGLPQVSAPLSGTFPKVEELSSHAILEAIAAFGFYVRKLLYPFPLNFTITKINSLLSISLVPVFTVTAWLLWKKDRSFRFPLVFLASSLIPPIGAMLLLPLWVPYAERYLYLPSVAFSFITALMLRHFGKNIPRSILVTCFLVLALPTTFRVRLWTEPLLFWQDSAKKAPNFGTARLVLASEYLKAGEYARAEVNLRQAVLLGFPSKSQESFLKIRKQLEEQSGVSSGKPSISVPTIPAPADTFLKQR